MNKSIFKTAVAVTVVAAFSIGCSEKADNDGDGGNGISGSRLLVNGAQAYSEYRGNAVESRYTGSFTYSMDYRLTDAFANPIVRMTNGKLTINLGEPIGGLMLVGNSFDGNSVIISDPTAKVLMTGYFGGEDGYFEGDDFVHAQYCDPSLLFVNINPESIIFFIYADKPVTISGSEERYDWDNNLIQCPVSFSLQKGWNTVRTAFDGRCETLEHITVDLSGSGSQKWIVYSSTESGDGLRKGNTPTRQNRFENHPNSFLSVFEWF